VLVAWTTNFVTERSSVGTRLQAGGRWLTVVTARPHQDRWLIGFDGVDDRNDADLLRGQMLMAEPMESEGDVFVHELVGKILVDQHGVEHGPVAAMVANPASDLIELDDGRLVPFAFYRSHDHERVVVDVPPGLLDGETA
jgi:16S rRNA processing protein RimM